MKKENEVLEEAKKEEFSRPEIEEDPKEKVSKYDSEELQKIEDERLAFLQQYRSANRAKSIIFFVVMFLLVATFIVLPTVGKDKQWQLPAMISIAVGLLGFVLLYSFLTRKKMTQKMREYFSVFYGNLNKFVFGTKHFDKIVFENPGKIEDHLFLDSGLYKDVFEVRSRGATTFEYDKKQMLVCDCAGSVKAYKRVQPIYVGKYLVTGNSYKGKEPIYIYIKGDQRSLPPTNIDEVKIVFDDKNMTIRSNDKNWNKFLTTSLVKKLGSLKPNKELVDIGIAIQPGTSYFALGYDDPLMVVPLDKPFNQAPANLYKKDIQKVCEIAKELD